MPMPMPVPARTRPPTAEKTADPGTIRTAVAPPAKQDSGRVVARNDSTGLRAPLDPSTPRTPTPVPTPAARPSDGVPTLPRTTTGSPPRQTEPVRARTPTPARIQPGAPTRQMTSPGSGGVVMTRPAVIVGAPAKTTGQTRVRKAREDEGRGFGQGLISEKSLDEVILAYLSEDSDDK
jgi:hypothetical protein